AGVLAPVTRQFDVALSPIRGHVSLSFAKEIADTWDDVALGRTLSEHGLNPDDGKPIHAFYFGDWDPSGLKIDEVCEEKLRRYCHRRTDFEWTRLGVNHEDFEAFDLIPLELKGKDPNLKWYRQKYGDHPCAEVDALPTPEVRRRVREAIKQYIPEGE